ncbi:hypothetical protein GS474_23925 [Rhodococcus hoagii]|nr:hypothetical protein [Prescottella equi]
MTAQGSIESIRTTSLSTWRQVITPGEPVALLDFPSYQNAGDSLIYVGERAYLRNLGSPVRYMTDSTRYDADELRRRHPEGTLLVRGGGNLGDRWLQMQDFRERVIEDFPDRRIIQLPQSVDFRTPERIDQCQRVFGKHPDLTLMIRDSRSMAEANRLFPDTPAVFCPDAAFGADRFDVGRDAPHAVVGLFRQDSEKVDHGGSLGDIVFDWGFSGSELRRWKMIRIPQSIARREPRLNRALYPVIQRGYDAQARMNVTAAVSRISQGRVLVTDRLHAAVFACLMGRPVVALDNANGKISAIAEDYLSAVEGFHYASSLDDARERVAHLVAATA